MATTASPTSSSSSNRPSSARPANSRARLVHGATGALCLQCEVAVHPRSVHRPGRQAVDRDAERSDLGGQRRGQTDHRHLRGAVGSSPGQWTLAAHRGQVDHVAGAAIDHRRQKGPAHQEDPADVDVEDRVPLGRARCRSSDGHRPWHAGIVDQDGDLLVSQRLRGKASRPIAIGDVDLRRPAQCGRPARSTRAAVSCSGSSERPVAMTRTPAAPAAARWRVPGRFRRR